MNKPRNIPASVQQRLNNLAHELGVDSQHILTRYGVERLLCRLSQSGYRERFVLKGGFLLPLWLGNDCRPTRDVDFHSTGEPAPERLAETFRGICGIAIADDGVVFAPESVQAIPIREDGVYQGVRVTLMGRLGNTRLHVQADVGFGDAITPGAQEEMFPCLLGFPGASILAYPRETVVAEKTEAMVILGIDNGRFKDFYDLWTFARGLSFDGATLSRAFKATFERRGTTLPTTVPIALTEAYTGNPEKQRHWQAFLKRHRLPSSLSLAEVSATLVPFLQPVLAAASKGQNHSAIWTAGGPWAVPDNRL